MEDSNLHVILLLSLVLLGLYIDSANIVSNSTIRVDQHNSIRRNNIVQDVILPDKFIDKFLSRLNTRLR